MITEVWCFPLLKLNVLTVDKLNKQNTLNSIKKFILHISRPQISLKKIKAINRCHIL